MSALKRVRCMTAAFLDTKSSVSSAQIRLKRPPVHRTESRFSSAVATSDNFQDEFHTVSNPRAHRISNMPRLQALRERLRREDIQSSGHRSSLDGLSNKPRLNPEVKMPEIDYSSSIDNILTDTHGRHHNYLRISLSERCNLRCQYCMPPEGVPLSPPSHLLTNDEIIRLVNLFVKHGVNKVRLTGGEPLLRPDLVSLVKSISESIQFSRDRNGVADCDGSKGLVGMTTNGISLSRHVRHLVDAGLTGVNISLDTLRDDRFVEITRRKGLDKVMRAIQDSIDVFRDRYGDVRVGKNGGSRVKINCVVMKGFNDDELVDFVNMANDEFKGDVDMRFIEWMPFNDNGWNRSRFVSYKDMMTMISTHSDSPLQLERIGDGPNDTTKWWKVHSREIKAVRSARIGFITSMSEHFCASCNRLRITADGKIKVCLFGSNSKEVSLRDIMRQANRRMTDGIEESDEHELSRVIHASVQKKSFSLGGHGNPENIAKAADNRPMTLIGG
ncbi:hypothetical protein HJC23_012488 [Cyclotella cryptica]|uniref:GTP 3',8-cyclase n=1 Tax=Cyclotella cryptica TaxID=29204 RepID=A0ABD3P9R1_9STRA|eukprot:CCRYP_016286-RA/>CCRYP_016286-RA protein AED:0.35 eAED:0.35 QI:0/-1/0/1/-1/1/1/0/499